MQKTLLAKGRTGGSGEAIAGFSENHTAWGALPDTQMTGRVPFSAHAETEVSTAHPAHAHGPSQNPGWMLGPGGDEVVLPLELGFDVGNRHRAGCGLSKAAQLARISCSPGPVPLAAPQGEEVVGRSPGTGTLKGPSPGEQRLRRAALPLTKNTP